jgi:hypothetical protein
MKKFFFIILVCLVIIPLLAQHKKVEIAKEFAVYDVFIEVEQGMSSWQFECSYNKDLLQISGIEGGQGVFSDPADYDSRGLNGGRIILAAYSLEKQLPKGKVWVSRLHVYEKKSELLNSARKLIVLADTNGKEIQGKISFEKVEK